MDDRARTFWVGIGRAHAGAVLFALPLLMTMEMWWLGFYMDRVRLALLLLVSIPTLTALSFYVGFERTFNVKEDLRDAFIALGIGYVSSAVVLVTLGIVTWRQPAGEIIGKIMLQAVPAAFGAMLARGQFGSPSVKEEDAIRRDQSSYGGELFLMAAGALYLAFSVAPTEEMILIAFQMTHWHGAATAVASLALLHSLVYALQFKGSHMQDQPGATFSVFLRFSVAGYGLVLLVSLYVLWTFGRVQELSPGQIILTAVVLGFPASLGAALARVII